MKVCKTCNTEKEVEEFPKGKGYKDYHDWNVVKSVECNDGIIILFLDTAYGFLFPESQLENPTDFLNLVNQRRA